MTNFNSRARKQNSRNSPENRSPLSNLRSILNCSIFLFSLITFILLLFPIKTVQADVRPIDCPLKVEPSSPIKYGTTEIAFNFDISGIKKMFETLPIPGKLGIYFPAYDGIQIPFLNCGFYADKDIYDRNRIPSSINTVIKKEQFTKCSQDPIFEKGIKKVSVVYDYDGKRETICSPKEFEVKEGPRKCNVNVRYVKGIGDIDSDWVADISDITYDDNPDWGSKFPSPTYLDMKLQVDGVDVMGFPYKKTDGNIITKDLPKQSPTSLDNGHLLKVYAKKYNETDYSPLCKTEFAVGRAGTPAPIPTSIPPTPTLAPDDPGCKDWSIKDCLSDPVGARKMCPRLCAVLPTTPTPPYPSLGPICDKLPSYNNDRNINFRKKCLECMEPTSGVPGIWTAVGCVGTNYTSIISYILSIGIGIAGAIAFLYFLYGAFMILTSSGNPEQIEEGKQMIVSSLSGLLLIIFSVFILARLIGIFQFPF